ncbi:MAG: IS701 family transposase [Azonexus sp.]|nr:IS701 family transposase [Azonexus sp.]
MAGSHYQRLHHMLSESNWSRAEVRQQLIVDANAHFGHGAALVFDESAFAKKGDKSVGVARQWNGRLGKTDNSQVGVFAALVRDCACALVDGELFVPEHWFDDQERSQKAGIPETLALAFRTKGEIALALLLRLRREGLRYSHVVFDAGYGHLPWLLNDLDDEGETFLAEIHADQRIYMENPQPAIPERTSPRGKAPQTLCAQTEAQTVTDWARAQPDRAWRRLSVRPGEKGEVIAEYLTRRVHVWDGKATTARCWHLLVRREVGGRKLKCCFANAKPQASLRRLASMQADRHFVERAFEDAKSTCGMADYQARGWQAWHHHMALVMIALMFLAKERLVHREITASMLSCHDLIDILRHKLPSKVRTDDDMAAMIEERHRRRLEAMQSAYRKQAETLGASN